MTDPRKEIADAQDTLASWISAPDAAVERVNRVGWRIYLITMGAAVVIAAVVASGLTFTFLSAWSNDWIVEHSSGRIEKCVRSQDSWFTAPHYVCTEHP